MHILPKEKQIAIIAALIEGCSIRATERLTGVHRDTIMRLGLAVGEKCAALHDSLFQGVSCPTIEMDEIWSFVGKKEKHFDRRSLGPRRKTGTKESGGRYEPLPSEFLAAHAIQGDQYTFLGFDPVTKAIISYHTGKRDDENTQIFIDGLQSRVACRPVLHSDSFGPYAKAVGQSFGEDISYGVLKKTYRTSQRSDGTYKDTGIAVKVEKQIISGEPGYISTNGVERENLTIRMQNRRFTRRCNGFSKKIRNHKASIALFSAHYNLCRVHSTIGTTPAIALGITNHTWSIEELIEAHSVSQMGKRVGKFTVIDGGIS